MSDIVERLRALTRCEHSDFSIGDEAADEIERLRAVVEAARRVKATFTLWDRDTGELVPVIRMSDIGMDAAAALGALLDALAALDSPASAHEHKWVLIPWDYSYEVCQECQAVRPKPASACPTDYDCECPGECECKGGTGREGKP